MVTLRHTETESLTAVSLGFLIGSAVAWLTLATLFSPVANEGGQEVDQPVRAVRADSLASNTGNSIADKTNTDADKQSYLALLESGETDAKNSHAPQTQPSPKCGPVALFQRLLADRSLNPMDLRYAQDWIAMCLQTDEGKARVEEFLFGPGSADNYDIIRSVVSALAKHAPGRFRATMARADYENRDDIWLAGIKVARHAELGDNELMDLCLSAERRGPETAFWAASTAVGISGADDRAMVWNHLASSDAADSAVRSRVMFTAAKDQGNLAVAERLIDQMWYSDDREERVAAANAMTYLSFRLLNPHEGPTAQRVEAGLALCEERLDALLALSESDDAFVRAAAAMEFRRVEREFDQLETLLDVSGSLGEVLERF